MSHIGREFTKILFQRRTYFGWAGVFLVPFLITVAMRLSSHADRPERGPESKTPVSSSTSSGPTVCTWP